MTVVITISPDRSVLVQRNGRTVVSGSVASGVSLALRLWTQALPAAWRDEALSILAEYARTGHAGVETLSDGEG